MAVQINDSSKKADLIRRRFQKIKEFSDPIFDSREINRNLYRSKINADETYEWDYSLVNPQVFPTVRNYLSRSATAQTNVRLDARRKDVVEKRQINQDFVNWELGELWLTSLFYRIYFSSYINGRGYAKTGWRYEPALKIQTTDENGEIVREVVMRDIINRASAKFVRFQDLLIPNRNNPLLQEQPYVIELIPMRVGDMLDENDFLEKKGNKPYWNKEWLSDLRESGVSTKVLDYQADIATDADGKEDLAFRSAYVNLMCMKTLENDEFYIPLEKDGGDIIVNEDQVGRFWHGHYPYIDYCPFPEDDEYYNLALVDAIGDIQIASTEVLNQMLTNIRDINNEMWIAGTGAAQTPDWQFQKHPSGIIRVVGDASQVQQVRTQDNTRSALLALQDLDTRGERAGGISSLYASGAPNQSVNQTARGAQIIDQNIDTNMKMIVDLFGEQVIKPLGEHFLELNAQYVTEEQSFYVTGRRGVRDFLAIDPDKVSANFDVTVNTDRMTKQTPASRQASLQNLATQIVGFQNTAGIQTDVTPIVEALVDSYPELDNVDDIIISVDEKAKRDISLLERGQMPEIKIRDHHQELIIAVNIHFAENEALYPEEIKQIFTTYAEKHLQYIQAQQQIIAMSQPIIPQAASPDQIQGGINAPGQETTQGTTEGLPGGGYNLRPL